MSLTGAANPSRNEKSTVDKICQQLTQGTRSLTKTQAAVKRMDPHRKTENKKLYSLRAALSHDQRENDCEELRNEKSERKTTLNTNTATTSTTITKGIMNGWNTKINFSLQSKQDSYSHGVTAPSLI
jgi:septal ring factor EnvC (AmiA/AmiB activator)